MQSDLREAMKARDARRVRALRSALAALSNAEAVDPTGQHERAGLMGDVARRDLDDADLRAIVRRERDQLVEAAGEMRALGQVDEADDLAGQAGILGGYLGD